MIDETSAFLKPYRLPVDRAVQVKTWGLGTSHPGRALRLAAFRHPVARRLVPLSPSWVVGDDPPVALLLGRAPGSCIERAAGVGHLAGDGDAGDFEGQAVVVGARDGRPTIATPARVRRR